jgi:DHA2 family multidrug resistance protein-like MFS transporter
VFVRRQRRLPDPLLDVTLFGDRAFTVALSVLLIGLVGVGGSMYLVTQYLQLVQGLTPFDAGLWMGPPALAMFAAAIGAPLVARRFRPGSVMGAALGASLAGYALLAGAGLDDEVPVAAGFTFVYLGLGALAALGTDMVVGAVPAARSGSAASISETVQELGIAVGVALLGSLTTAVYRARVTVPGDLTSETSGALTDSLNATLAISESLPPGTVEAAQQAFTSGLNLASLVAGIAIAVAAVLCLGMLRHVPTLGEARSRDTDV